MAEMRMQLMALALIGLAFPAMADPCERAFIGKRWPTALTVCRKAATQGEGVAPYYLGVIFSKGYGTPTDLAVAALWYRVAAERGFDRAQYALAGLYANGDGVAQDNAEAYFWYRLAAGQRNLSTDILAKIEDNLGHLARNLSADQIASLYSRIARWKPSAKGVAGPEATDRPVRLPKMKPAQSDTLQNHIEAERLPDIYVETDIDIEKEGEEPSVSKLPVEADTAISERQAALTQPGTTEDEADQSRDVVEGEKSDSEQGTYGQRLAALTIGQKSVNIIMIVVTSNPQVRDLPDESGQKVRQIAKGQQVRVVAMLPSGWAQIAEEQELIGWIRRNALQPLQVESPITEGVWEKLKKLLKGSTAPSSTDEGYR